MLRRLTQEGVCEYISDEHMIVGSHSKCTNAAQIYSVGGVFVSLGAREKMLNLENTQDQSLRRNE
jgi:hypothetical protein